MITENSTKNTQAQAFSYFAVAGNMGILIGPLIGGALESPASKFTSTFGRVHFFQDYPYALPGFAAAAFGLSAAILITFFVKEVGTSIAISAMVLMENDRLYTSTPTE